MAVLTMRLVECRVLRPIELFGRVCATHERVRLDERDALPLIESGHLREIIVLAEINGSGRDRWIQPTER